MTQEELKERLAAIDRQSALQKKAAYFEYVKDNAKYKIGDVVSDETDTIRIERIDFNIFATGVVSIYYWGVMLTKKGEPRKDGQKRAIYEERIVER